jgi:hypothetical protein
METIPLEEKAKKKKKQKNKLTKDAINVIRTTQRNNVELTHLADNKANVLLSLNALMLTFLIPGVVSNTEYIIERFLYIPLFILAATCFLTIYISTLVLKPSNFDQFHDENDPNRNYSPFFFGNFYRMKPEEFFQHLDESLNDTEVIRKNLAQDMFYVGRRLGFKMTWIRRAFVIFLWGMFFSILSTFVVLAI